MASFSISFSPPIVGAYRIRPDVGEQEMMVASIPTQFRESFPSLGVFAAVEGVCDTPLHIYYLFVGGCGDGWHRFVKVFRRQLSGRMRYALM